MLDWLPPLPAARPNSPCPAACPAHRQITCWRNVLLAFTLVLKLPRSTAARLPFLSRLAALPPSSHCPSCRRWSAAAAASSSAPPCLPGRSSCLPSPCPCLCCTGSAGDGCACWQLMGITTKKQRPDQRLLPFKGPPFRSTRPRTGSTGGKPCSRICESRSCGAGGLGGPGGCWSSTWRPASCGRWPPCCARCCCGDTTQGKSLRLHVEIEERTKNHAQHVYHCCFLCVQTACAEVLLHLKYTLSSCTNNCTNNPTTHSIHHTPFPCALEYTSRYPFTRLTYTARPHQALPPIFAHSLCSVLLCCLNRECRIMRTHPGT